jgi:hypothetical protein
MFQARQDLPFLAESPHHRIALSLTGVMLHDLDRHQFGEFVIGPDGLVDHSHAARADGLDQPVAFERRVARAGNGTECFILNRRFASGRLVAHALVGVKQLLYGPP